jgi:hypothetical protein
MFEISNHRYARLEIQGATKFLANSLEVYGFWTKSQGGTSFWFLFSIWPLTQHSPNLLINRANFSQKRPLANLGSHMNWHLANMLNNFQARLAFLKLFGKYEYLPGLKKSGKFFLTNL